MVSVRDPESIRAPIGDNELCTWARLLTLTGSGGSRGGARGARPPLFWVKRRNDRKKKSRQGK